VKSTTKGGRRGVVRWSVRQSPEGFWWLDLHASGKRTRKRFKTRQAAEIYGKRAEDRANRQGAELAATPAAEVAGWKRVVDLAKAAGVDPEEAMKAGIQAILADRASVPVCEAVEAFLKEKEVAGKGRGWRDFRDLRWRLGKLVLSKELGRANLNAVKPHQFDAWLRSLPGNESSRATYRRALGRLLRWAARRGWCDERTDGRLEVKRTAQVGAACVLDLSDFLKVLEAAEGELRAVVVLVAMCGLRTSEAIRCRWGVNVRLGDGVLIVGEGQAKTAQRRVIQLPPGALAWLRPLAREDGAPVWSKGGERAGDEYLRRRLEDVERVSGVNLPQNVLRQSCLSYKRAECGDDGVTAGYGGTSPAMVRTRYANAVTVSGKLIRAEDGRRWFECAPAESSNLVNFSASS
jgi:hypothetical protein